MAGTFEIVKEGHESFHFRLTAEDGSVVAISPAFKTLKGVTAGIVAVRENAATGLIVDCSAPRISG
jgi:uncharacterized protein YegP (UPF0339 family)